MAPRTPSNGAPHSVQKMTLVSQVTQVLLEKIAARDLLPGAKIDVKGLCTELDISPTPVREALQRLAQDGVLESRPFVGYFVVELTREDISQLFGFREAIETFALRHAFDRVDHEAWRALFGENERLLQEIRRDGLNPTTQREYRRLDQKLHHQLIVRGSGNKWLAHLSGAILDLIFLTWDLTANPEAGALEHEVILSAVLAHDLDSSVAALSKHLARAKDEALAESGK